MSLIYYVEDDADIRNLVVYTLNATGFESSGFENGAEFRIALKKKSPDLILLDVMLPGEDGFDLLRQIKAHPLTARIPVMMITARDTENDCVDGLDFGADDYVSKPFGVMELLARVKAVLRRCTPSQGDRLLRSEDIIMDMGKHTVEAGGIPVQLTLKEYALLQQLLENTDHLVEREQLIQRVWGGDCSDANHTLDAHIRTLRTKLGISGSRIQTIYGRGYRLRTSEANE